MRDKNIDLAFSDVISCVLDMYMSQHTVGDVERLENITKLSTSGDFAYIIDSVCAVIVYTEQRRILSTTETPLIIGCMGLFNMPVRSFVLKFIRPVTVYKIKRDTFQKLVNDKKLWGQIAHICGYYLYLLVKLRQNADVKTNYELVKRLLIEYQSLSDGIQVEVSLCRYLMEKGFVSRSSAMNVLSELQKRGDIMMKRGRLIQVSY